VAEGCEECGRGGGFVQSLHRLKKMVLEKKDRKIANCFDCLKSTQSLYCSSRMVSQKKDPKIANFLTV